MSNQNEKRVLLVGSHFHPPAKILLEVLPQGSPVYFESEPENPYDALAVKVFVLSEDLDKEELAQKEEELNGYGHTTEGVLGETSWCLGHVGASEGKPILKARLAGLRGLIGTRELSEMEDLPRGFIEFEPSGQFITIKLEEDGENE